MKTEMIGRFNVLLNEVFMVCDTDMWIYDQEPDYDNHICPLAGVSNYCIYGHGEACSTCEALLAYDKYCEDIENS